MLPLIANLYAGQPGLVWLTLSAAFLALELILGRAWLIWPSIAAATVALIALAHVRLGLPLEIILWLAGSGASAYGAQRLLQRERQRAEAAAETLGLAAAPEAGEPLTPAAPAGPE